MKPRKTLSAGEVATLHEELGRRLDAIGVPSQPEIAMKLLELSRNPRAALADYAKVIRNDQAISGRVMRLANSAFFAQRKPVTTIDRACVVLGTDRLKAVSLGFTLGKAASCAGDAEFSRKVWGESLYRACLAAELARSAAPSSVSEAFVIGLMMDAGLGMMTRLCGEPFRAALMKGDNPARLFRIEFDELPFTHVDVIGALARKWKFPELLTKPLELHHTRPAEGTRDDAVSRLHRVAFVVGQIELKAAGSEQKIIEPARSTPGVSQGQRILSLTDAEMSRAVKQSFSEYSITIEMFSDIAERLCNLDSLWESVQVDLAHAVDHVLEQEISSEGREAPLRLVVAGKSIELTRDCDGAGVAYLYDSRGARLLSHRFDLAKTSPADVIEALGLDAPGPGELEAVRQSLARMAA